MIGYIRNLWNIHGFEILFVVCLIFIGIFAIARIGKKGTWSTSYHYIQRNTKNKQKNVKYSLSNDRPNGPPKESKGEKECRRVLRKYFSKPFNNCRPDFLRNPVTGGKYNLEIDCYDEELRLGVEYSGKQHYEYCSYMHKNKEAFYNQKYRDDMKRRICRDNRVNLIEVSYKVKIEDIERYLYNELVIRGYKIHFVK